MSKFTLKKVKKIDGGGLSVDWTATTEEDGTVIITNHSEERPVIPHPDLLNAMKDLKIPFLHCLGLDAMIMIRDKGNISKEERDNLHKVDKYIDGTFKTFIERLEVTGISINGEDRDKIKITGKFDDINGTAMALNSPLINVSQDVYGVEKTVKAIVDVIDEETEEYILNHKKTEFKQAKIESDG